MTDAAPCVNVGVECPGPFPFRSEFTPRYGFDTAGVVGGCGAAAPPGTQNRFTTPSVTEYVFPEIGSTNGGSPPAATGAVTGVELLMYVSPVSPALLTGFVGGFGIASGG